MSARAVDAKGRTTSASLDWSSANPAIATVGKSDGTVTAIAVGATILTVTVGNLSAAVAVSVRPPDPPVSISITSSALILIPGGVERLVARAFDAAGRATSVTFEWSSADPAVATVGRNDGIVTAIAVGATKVTTAIGALRATATVSVIAMGSSYAFTRFTEDTAGNWNRDVLSFSAEDGTTRALPHSSTFPFISSPAWSSDGALLAVEVIQKFFAGNDTEDGGDYNSDLYILGADAPADAPWRRLTTNGLSKAPSWSPDGKRIAYLQQPTLFANSDIYVVDAAGGGAVRLTRTSGLYSGPRWSPDGTRIAFTDLGVGNGEIFIINADGSGLTNVTRNSAYDRDPSWSPDGARLAFISSRESATSLFRIDVFVANADGTNAKRLTSLPEYCDSPAWSPDGRYIMFSSGASLYVMNADGSSLVRLTTPPGNSVDRGPAWRR